jgi:hypothetical protein
MLGVQFQESPLNGTRSAAEKICDISGYRRLTEVPTETVERQTSRLLERSRLAEEGLQGTTSSEQGHRDFTDSLRYLRGRPSKVPL